MGEGEILDAEAGPVGRRETDKLLVPQLITAWGTEEELEQLYSEFRPRPIYTRRRTKTQRKETMARRTSELQSRMSHCLP